MCSNGSDIYSRPSDMSHEFSARWNSGREQIKPHWTPDGSHIVFGHQGRIYVVDANGSELRCLSGSSEVLNIYSETTEIDFSPTVSPDGSRVAYTTLRYATGGLYEHTYEIASQAIDRSDRQRLTHNAQDDFSPAWSPDGSWIAFISEREDGPRLMTVVPDGSAQRIVAPSVDVQPWPPLWSSEGHRLAFVGEKREVATVEYVDSYVASRPVTETAEFEILRESLYTVKPDGSDLREILWVEDPESEPRTRKSVSDLGQPEEDIRSIRWSLDGSQLAFVARYYGEPDAIYIASSDGAKTKKILEISRTEQYQRDGYAGIQDLTWSEDGTRINFEAGGLTVVVSEGYVHSLASVYSVAADGTDLRIVVDKEDLNERPRWGDKLVKDGPAQLIRYTYSNNANVPQEYQGRILATVPWGEHEEKALVRTANNRLVPANPHPSAVSTSADLCSDDLLVPERRKRG